MSLRPPKMYMGSLNVDSRRTSRCIRLGHSVAVMVCFESGTTRGTRVKMEKRPSPRVKRDSHRKETAWGEITTPDQVIECEG